MIISYKYETPEQVEVMEEYIVVQAFKMVGDIGGTIGIFIGFAFSPFVTLLLEYFKFLVSGRVLPCKFAGNEMHHSFIYFSFSVFQY